MQAQEYYLEIDNLIKRNEINKKRRILEENYDTLTNYWHIGKLLVEAQGDLSRARYGNELIKKWSIEFTKNYGNGYSASNLMRFRQLYITFPILAPVVQISWSNILQLLSIKDENKKRIYEF